MKKDGEHKTSHGPSIPPIFRLEQIPEEEREAEPQNNEDEDDDSSYETENEDDLLSARIAEETLQSAISLLTSSSKGSLEEVDKEAQIFVNKEKQSLDALKSWNEKTDIDTRGRKDHVPAPPTLPKPETAPTFRRNRYSRLPKPQNPSSSSQISIRSVPISHSHKDYEAEDEDLPVIDSYSRSNKQLPRAETDLNSSTLTMKYRHVDSYTEKHLQKEKEIFNMIKNDLMRKQYAEKIRQENRLANALRAASLWPPRVDPTDMRKQKEHEKLNRVNYCEVTF